MPIKYNLTKYDKLLCKIKKVAVKKDPKEMTKEDETTMFKAVLIAAFTSGHSWQTYKVLASQDSGSLKKPEIRKEYEEALSAQWKTVQPADINEVANTNISETSFSEWLFFNVAKEQHDHYKDAWRELQAELNEDCDSVERVTN